MQVPNLLSAIDYSYRGASVAQSSGSGDSKCTALDCKLNLSIDSSFADWRRRLIETLYFKQATQDCALSTQHGRHVRSHFSAMLR